MPSSAFSNQSGGLNSEGLKWRFSSWMWCSGGWRDVGAPLPSSSDSDRPFLLVYTSEGGLIQIGSKISSQKTEFYTQSLIMVDYLQIW